MAGSGARPPVGDLGPSGKGKDLTRQEAAEYISSLLEGLRVVAHGAQMPFLAYLLDVALEEANNEKANHR
jgi:hypothetical protein